MRHTSSILQYDCTITNAGLLFIRMYHPHPGAGMWMENKVNQWRDSQMVKRLRENRKNKKGFTLVELIVVIVIILVLAAVMVPSVLKYVDRANQANTKSDAATILVDVQAQIADAYSAAEAGAPTSVTSNGVTVAKTADLISEKGTKAATYNETNGDLISFSYRDPNHWIQWSKDKGWSAVDTALTTP